jgi:hypothetical protein
LVNSEFPGILDHGDLRFSTAEMGGTTLLNKDDGMSVLGSADDIPVLPRVESIASTHADPGPDWISAPLILGILLNG